MSRSPRAGATDLGYDPETGTRSEHHPDHAVGFDTADTGYRLEYDPGRFDPPTDPNLPIVPTYLGAGMQEATTSIFAAVPAQAGREESADDSWADPTWGHRSWDRPDHDDHDHQGDYGVHTDYAGYADGADGLGEFDRFGGFDGADGFGAFGGFAGVGAAPDPHGALPAPALADAPARPGTRLAALVVPVVVGVAISVGLGVYARVHEGTGTAINLAGFSSGLAAKSWLTAAAFVLVLVQLWTSMRMYGRIGRNRPAGPRTATVHRWAGRLAVLVTIPVAVHCLYALGFSDANLRVLAHSLLGCFFYGAFAAKMLVLPRHDAPRWALPVLGGLVFTVLTGLVLTSAVWFFTTKGLTF
ncbi:DUF6529 family protein [Pseudonocardia sp. RS11V-5]|uniref:DUF6529 family protein n=1 Tax=Pseudonocardia terrae TaxID=2905831 RepID=UPI001E2B9446|nr:DUF6529 family protein [Pseudonocardia terrae]MCE3554327.1 DUF6529 family protein [Pseudonocardia terrae]